MDKNIMDKNILALLRKYKLNTYYGVEINDMSKRDMLTIKYLYKLLSGLEIYQRTDVELNNWATSIRIYTNKKHVLFATLPVSLNDVSLVDIYLYAELGSFIKRFDKNKILLVVIKEIVKELYNIKIDITKYSSTIMENNAMNEDLLNSDKYIRVL